MMTPAEKQKLCDRILATPSSKHADANGLVDRLVAAGPPYHKHHTAILAIFKRFDALKEAIESGECAWDAENTMPALFNINDIGKVRPPVNVEMIRFARDHGCPRGSSRALKFLSLTNDVALVELAKECGCPVSV